jgi:hypothetical protein
MTTSITAEPEPVALDAAPRVVGRRHDVPVIVFCGITLVAAAVMYWAVHYSLADDAYITLAYAKQLAFHGNWGMVPSYSANSATSPLNVMLIAAGTFVTRRPLLGLGIVYVASYGVLAFTLARTARTLRLPLASAVLAVALILLNPWVLSSTGLESVVYAALLGSLLCCAVEGRPIWFGVVAGLALLCRLDMVVFIIPLVVWSPPLRRNILRVIGIAAAVSLPWFVLRWFVAGSAIPDTFVIKTLQHSFGDITFANGPFRFTQGSSESARWAFFPVLVAAIALVLWLLYGVIFERGFDQRLYPLPSLGIAGFAYYTTYANLNVPPYHWYYCPVMIAASIVLAFIAGDMSRRLRRVRPLRKWTWALFIPVVLLVGQEALVVKHHGLPWRHVPLWYTNWAEPEYYRLVGREVHKIVGDKTVTSPGEVGALAFYCNCNIVDQFADQRYAVPLIEARKDDSSPVMRWFLDLNYHNLDTWDPPAPPQYHLVYEPGWTQDPFTWNVYSGWRGFGHFRLLNA